MTSQDTAKLNAGRGYRREYANAGFNLLELPALRGVFHPTLGLNQWMGFARNWGPGYAQQAAFMENAVRVGVPAAGAAAGYAGYEIGSALEE